MQEGHTNSSSCEGSATHGRRSDGHVVKKPVEGIGLRGVRPHPVRAVARIAKMRTVSLYSRLLDSVNQLHQKVTAADAKRAAVRANVLAFMALLVAVALGLPALQASIDIARRVSSSSALKPTTRPLVWLGDQGPSGVWAAFLGFLGVSVLSWIVGAFALRNRPSRRRWLPAGQSWGVPLTVTNSDADQNVSDDGK